MSDDRKLNTRNAIALRIAKLVGMLAPMTALLAAAIAFGLRV
jgi:hypothetical protein